MEIENENGQIVGNPSEFKLNSQKTAPTQP